MARSQGRAIVHSANSWWSFGTPSAPSAVAVVVGRKRSGAARHALKFSTDEDGKAVVTTKFLASAAKKQGEEYLGARKDRNEAARKAAAAKRAAAKKRRSSSSGGKAKKMRVTSK